eukprot:2764580-Pyramimonas_sp.AAC.1
MGSTHKRVSIAKGPGRSLANCFAQPRCASLNACQSITPSLIYDSGLASLTSPSPMNSASILSNGGAGFPARRATHAGTAWVKIQWHDESNPTLFNVAWLSNHRVRGNSGVANGNNAMLSSSAHF